MRRDQTFKTASIAGASDLTIVAPIKKGLVPALDAITYKTRVKRVLRLLHLGRTAAHEYEIGRVLSDAVERVGKIHSIRIAILEPEDKVLLVVTFDGAWESYIRVIWQKVSRLLDLIFCNTEGYVLGWESTFDEWCAWLRKAQAETPFLYSQPSLTNSDTHYLRSLERMHRRAEPSIDVNQQIAKFITPTAENQAKSLIDTGDDLSNGLASPVAQSVLPSGPAFRQGLKTLVGLYRMSDAYLSTIGDGEVLHRAAQELLFEFKELAAEFAADPDLQEKIEEVKIHYKDAWNWFTAEDAYQRTVPDLPESQASLHPITAVQGGILTGYANVSVGCLLLIAFESAEGMASFLTSFKPTTAAEQNILKAGDIAQNLAVTVEGLRRAGLSDEEMGELPEEFLQGMDKRQGVLGDFFVNHPRRWRLPVQNWEQGIDATDEAGNPRVQLSSIHAVIQLRMVNEGDTNDQKKKLFAKLQKILGTKDKFGAYTMGAIPLSLQWMHRLTDTEGKGIEHFGFRDADSNPVFEHVSHESGYDNQVHIGEVLNGYPNAADHGVPANGAKSDRAKALLSNGSFLVIRKLHQDVEALESLLQKAKRTLPALNKDTLLAKMMGRWPAGAKDSKGQLIEGQPLLMNDAPQGSNDFDFVADYTGVHCPFHAHIRRSNPRSSEQVANAIGGRLPRIVRRGMSFGERYVESTDAQQNGKSLKADRGLMFMAYNASIGEQFEVVQRWISGGNSTGTYSGHSDPFLGVSEPGRPRIFQFVHEGSVARIELDGSDEVHLQAQPLVRLEWGMYLFAPSIVALDYLATRASKQAKSPVLEWSVDRGELLIAELKKLESGGGNTPALHAWKTVLEDPDSAADFTAASIWAAIRRNHAGVLKTSFGALVASQKLADQILLDQEGNLTAQGYLPRMRNSFGELYLGMDIGRTDQAYEKEAPIANAEVLALGERHDETVEAAEKIVHDAIEMLVAYSIKNARGEKRWQATIDVRDVVEKVIAHFCETWFGLSTNGGYFEKGGIRWQSPVASLTPRYPGHFMAPSRYVFQPHPSDTVREVASIHGKALNDAMAGYLQGFGTQLKFTHPLVKAVLERGDELGDAGYPPRTILGLMMGFVPTTDGLMRRIAHEWLREGTLWSLRTHHTGAAQGMWSDPGLAASFKRAFEQAFLLRAAPELLWRTAKKDHQIGEDGNKIAVKTGDVVIVGQISAAHEGLENPGKKTDQEAYDHSYRYAFGDCRKSDDTVKPTHACPGRNAAMAVMKGFLKGLVTCKYPMQPGPGALSFVVEGASDQTPPLWRQDGVSEQFKKPLDAIKNNAGGTSKIELFAIGDSWVFQRDLTKPGFFNLTSALKKKGFSFAASSAKYPPPQDPLNAKVFNFAGATLAELPTKSDLVKQRFKILKEQHLDIAAVLLSAGGNDISACETKMIEVIEKGEKIQKKVADYTTSNLFKMLVEDATSATDAFAADAKRAFFDELKKNYVATFQMLLASTDAPILVHGYDYPCPDSVGLNVDGFKRGPWLGPVFELKRISYAVGLDVMRKLIDDLNNLISSIVCDKAIFPEPELKRLHYIKLTSTLEEQADYKAQPDGYKKYWANELHATEIGFDALAQPIVDKLVEIKSQNTKADIAAVGLMCPFR